MKAKKSKKKMAPEFEIDIQTEEPVALVSDEAPEASVSPDPEAPPAVEKRLTRAELLELRALAAESQLAAMGIETITQKRDMLLMKLDPEGKIMALSGNIRALADEATRLNREHLRMKSEIEKRLGINNLADYTFDDMSGELKLP